jgi:hypothetical protein
MVQKFKDRRVTLRFTGQSRLYKCTWRVHEDTLDLDYKRNTDCLATFFASENWADGIPRPKTLEIIASNEAPRDVQRPMIPLYTISEFKGLEADGIVLFVMSPREHMEASLYVGLSRARLFLNVVIQRHTLSRIPDISAQ